MLQIQIHIKLPKPLLGVEYTREFLDELAQMWLDCKKLPPRVKVSALSWKSRESAPWYKEARPGKIETARESFSKIKGFRFTGVSALG